MKYSQILCDSKNNVCSSVRSQNPYHLCQEAPCSLVLVHVPLLSLTCKFLSKGLRANLYIPTEPSTQCLPMFSGVLICLKETHICYLQQLVGARQLSRLWLGISGSWVLMRTVKLSDSSTGLGDLLPASSHDCCRKSQPQAKALTTLPEWVMMEKEGRNKVREGKK